MISAIKALVSAIWLMNYDPGAVVRGNPIAGGILTKRKAPLKRSLPKDNL